MKTLLEVAFSGITDNIDLIVHVKQIGVPGFDVPSSMEPSITKAILPPDAIKVDIYLSQLQWFRLDAASPSAAILECTEAGEAKAVASTCT